MKHITTINILAAIVVAFLAFVLISTAIPGETRQDRIDALFDPGPLHGELIEAVTDDLVAPESFQHSKTEYTDQGGNAVLVNMYFTALTSNGTRHMYIAHATIDTTGKIIQYHIEQ